MTAPPVIERASSSGSGEDRRRALVNAARGYITETFPESNIAQQVAMISQRAYYHLIALLAGETATGVDVRCHTVGNTLTLVKAAIVKTDLTAIRAVSADEKAQFSSTGKKSLPFLTPYTAPEDEVLAVELLAIGTTGPTLDSGHTSGKNGYGAHTGKLPHAGFRGGVSDVATGGSIGVDGSTIAFWTGIY